MLDQAREGSRVKQKCTQIALLLLEAGADPNCPYDPSTNPYPRRNYWADHRFDPRKNHYSPLAKAVDVPLLEVVQALLDHGANVNQEGEPPLYVAACSGNTGMALLLLAHGANPNWQNDMGFTPLIQAVGSNDKVLVRTLLAKGANPALKDWTGETALDGARRFKEQDMVTLLSQYAKNRNKQKLPDATTR